MADEAGAGDRPVAGVDRRGEALVVNLRGELDLYNAPQVRSALLDACAQEPERLVVNLAEVEFVDSTVLGVLVEARTKLANPRSFFVTAPGLETRRALEVSGLVQHLNVRDSVDDALAASPR